MQGMWALMLVFISGHCVVAQQALDSRCRNVSKRLQLECLWHQHHLSRVEKRCCMQMRKSKSRWLFQIRYAPPIIPFLPRLIALCNHISGPNPVGCHISLMT